MAISLGGYKKYGAAMDEHKRQKKEYEAMQAQAASRRKKSGLFGCVLGTLMGAGLNLLVPGSGLLMQGLLTGAGKFLGKGLGHQLAGPGIDPSQLQAKGKYGLGKESAETL